MNKYFFLFIFIHLISFAQDTNTVISGEKVSFFRADTLVWTEERSSLENTVLRMEYVNNKKWNGKYEGIGSVLIYKKGKEVEEWSYEGVINRKKVQITYYNLNSDVRNSLFRKPKIIKVKSFVGNKTYTLSYKNGKKHEGTILEEDELIRYKNGKKNGAFIRYDDFPWTEESIIGKGNYQEGNYHGIITFFSPEGMQYSCEYKNGKPWKGQVLENAWLTSYDKGLKDGTETFSRKERKDSLVFSRNYRQGKLEGSCTGFYYQKYFYGKVVSFHFNGVYKDDQPYSGTFYNKKMNTLEEYVQGKKEGLFTDKGNYFIHKKNYKNGLLVSKKSILDGDTSIYYSMNYEGNKAMNGAEVNLVEKTNLIFRNRLYIKKEFINGSQNGHEEWFICTRKKMIPIAQIPIKNGKKEGKAWCNFDRVEYNRIKLGKLEGVYKNNKPFSGDFVLITMEGFTEIAQYSKGKKISSKWYYPRKKQLKSRQ